MANSITLENLKNVVRGFCVDTVDSTGSYSTFFTDTQITNAINFAKGDLFANRPEAFNTNTTSSHTFVVDEPTDLASDSDTLSVFGYAQVPLCYKAASILLSQKGKDEFYRKAADEMLTKYIQGIS